MVQSAKIRGHEAIGSDGGDKAETGGNLGCVWVPAHDLGRFSCFFFIVIRATVRRIVRRIGCFWKSSIEQKITGAGEGEQRLILRQILADS